MTRVRERPVASLISPRSGLPCLNANFVCSDSSEGSGPFRGLVVCICEGVYYLSVHLSKSSFLQMREPLTNLIRFGTS
jgi:hypothetical protein